MQEYRFVSKDPVNGVLISAQTQNPYSYSLNPINLSDPSGEFAFVPVLVAAWAIAELGLTASDAYDFANTLQDPNANLCDKSWSGALAAAGLIGPGGGYGKIDDAIKFVSPTDNQIRLFTKQLAEQGEGSLLKSRASFEKLIHEHEIKINAAKSAGGYTSSMEKEIQNFLQQISAIDRVLKR